MRTWLVLLFVLPFVLLGCNGNAVEKNPECAAACADSGGYELESDEHPCLCGKDIEDGVSDL